MNAEQIPMLSLYLPLWGLSFDSDNVGAIGPGVLCYLPFDDEWRTVQHSAVWAEQWRSLESEASGQVPCCVVVYAALDGAESLSAAIAAHGARLHARGRMALDALRLYRGGWFLEPEHALTTFYAPSFRGRNVERAPGPYRQAFNSGTEALPLTGYALHLDDLNQSASRPGPIAAVWQLLERYQDSGGNTSVAIALESFRRSYGYQLRPSSRVANLFTALEAMLGGMHAWKIGPVAVKPRGYARRVATALSCCGPAVNDEKKLQQDARWLHAEQGGRGLRNAIAHGAGEEVELAAAQAYDRLQEIVRVLLRQYLHFAAQWATGTESIAVRLGLKGSEPLAAAYVTALEAEARQTGALRDLLCPGAAEARR